MSDFKQYWIDDKRAFARANLCLTIYKFVV
jgi:hypothetical protein